MEPKKITLSDLLIFAGIIAVIFGGYGLAMMR